MTLNPDIQAKAHAELDRVVGKCTLPTFADESSLPYVGAIAKEVLRCGLSSSMVAPKLTHFIRHAIHGMPTLTIVWCADGTPVLPSVMFLLLPLSSFSDKYFGIWRYVPAIPHFVEEDDEYNGYLIPKDSIVVGNAWFAQSVSLKIGDRIHG